MERHVYAEMARIEDQHWWFRGRRAIVKHALDRLALPGAVHILEAGCGSGGNLALLAQYGYVSACEPDASARAQAVSRGIGRVEEGALPHAIPFAQQHFDLIALFDVLEHVQEDTASLRSLYERVTPDGHLILTVPAMPWLWSRHDVMHHHFRRYTRRSLRRVVEAAGFHITFITYFNVWLFPLIAMVRVVERLLPATASSVGGHVPHPFINAWLYRLFSSERVFQGIIRPPFGVSLLAIASRKR